MGADQFDKSLRLAEVAAELPRWAGGLWHPYRRAWATARKHLPLADVAQGGGWAPGSRTLTRSYQQPDDETLLAVMSETRKVMTVQGQTV